MLTLVRVSAALGGPVEEERQEFEELLMGRSWRRRTCRYPSFSTFLFSVEFQWFLMALSVLKTKHSSC